MNKVTQISEHRDSAIYSALEAEALEILEERDKTEREIKRLGESGKRDEAWALVVELFQIKEPRLRRIK